MSRMPRGKIRELVEQELTKLGIEKPGMVSNKQAAKILGLPVEVSTQRKTSNRMLRKWAATNVDPERQTLIASVLQEHRADVILRDEEKRKARAKRQNARAKSLPRHESPPVVVCYKPPDGEVLLASKSVTGDDFLRSFEWRKLRMRALQKYGRKCQCCGATPESGAIMNVDHIKPRRVYPELALTLENLQILCHECNHGKGNWDMTDWRKTEEA